MTEFSRKIALFLPALNGGGAERAFVTLAQALKTLGHDPYFLLLKREGVFLDQLGDIPAYDMRRSFLTLLAALKKDKPDILISGLPLPILMGILAQAVRPGAFRHIATAHTIEARRRDTYRTPARRLKWCLMKLLYRHARHFVGVSGDVARELQTVFHVPATRVHVLPNPIDARAIRTLAARESGHPWLGQKEVPVILGAGRLVPQKDFQALLAAFSRVRTQKPCRLIILGEGPERPALEKRARDLGISGDIDMPGFVNNLYPFMASADLFALTSQTEGFGNVLAEALCLGTKIVAVNCGSGPREILGDGLYGRLVPPGDLDALAEALSRALTKDDSPHSPVSHLMQYESHVVADRYLGIALK